MNEKIKEAKIEMEMENYENALEMLDEVNEDDEDYKLVLLIRYMSLMNLKRYGEALRVVNSLIEKFPYNFFLWVDKARCHIFLKDKDNAFKALTEMERLVDDDVGKLLLLARLYDILDDNENVLKFCNMALDIDENNRGALILKATVALNLNNFEMADELAAVIVGEDRDLLSVLPGFLLMVFSQNFEGAYGLVGEIVDENVDDEVIGMFKYVIFSQMCESLDVELLLVKKLDLSIDDAIRLLLKYQKEGVDSGVVCGVEYMIV